MDFGFIVIIQHENRSRRRRDLLTRRHIRDANNPFELEDSFFHNLFRFNKDLALILIRNLESDLRRVRSNGLPVHIIVLTAVRFFAVGSYQRSIGQEFNLALAQRTVSKIVAEVSKSIIRRLFPQFIKFPSTAAERKAVANGFQSKHNLPDCLGCIDCTHITIVTPYNNTIDPPVGYKNRKGYYSINTQFVCDSDCRLLNVNARYPGSTHDQLIFNNSIIKSEMARLNEGRIGKYYLIGDSGYAKEPYLLTPILPTPAEGTPQEKYNTKISRVRNCIERTNGIIKAIFRCMRKDRVLHYQPVAAARIILSCCTIYNMMHYYRCPLPDEREIDDNDEEISSYTSGAGAIQRQNDMINYINNQSR